MCLESKEKFMNMKHIKKEIMFHPLFDKFYFYLHGSLVGTRPEGQPITNFENTVDIDMKLVPREKITINQLESMMEFLVNIGVDVVFMREVNTYVPKYKPSMKDIRENDKPILQAKINVDIDELNNRKRDLKQFLYNQNIRYRKIGKLCFYISPEWAVEGYVFNRKWFYIEYKKRNVDYKRILWSGNVDIREDWLDEI